MTSSTMALTWSLSVTLAPLAIASPPAAFISSTTASAADTEPSSDPSTFPPRSFTTTFAPLLAKSRAWHLPKPPPAPVTIATRSLKVIDIISPT